MKSTLWKVLAILFPIVAALAIYFHDKRWLFLMGTFEVLLIAIFVTTFVIVYSTRNWRANPYGRGLMYSKISLALFADLSLITNYFGPEWPYRATVRFLVFLGIVISQGRLLQLVITLRSKESREQYELLQATQEKDKEKKRNG